MNTVFQITRGLASAFIIIAFGSFVIVAQSEISGTWTAKVSEKSPDKIQLNFDRSNTGGGRQSSGNSFLISELPGIDSQTVRAGGGIRFQLVREAGTIDCEGSFQDGKGRGTFRFVANPGYLDAMLLRGFDFTQTRSDSKTTTEDRLFTAALLDVKVATADDLRTANFPNLGVDDLFKATIFKIDGRYISEMAATGFPNLTMDEIVKARIFKIDAEFVRSIKDMGFGTDNFEHLVKYSIFKVTPEYLNELRAEGLTELTPEEIVKLRIFRIDGAYVRQVRAEDPNITVEKIVQRKLGVHRVRVN
ncbi:MAG: hypothetical protein H0V76_08375 [Blastocatellia bacterium]|nr:hypothetical protein [Blastocatellia bacterium]